MLGLLLDSKSVIDIGFAEDLDPLRLPAFPFFENLSFHRRAMSDTESTAIIIPVMKLEKMT